MTLWFYTVAILLIICLAGLVEKIIPPQLVQWVIDTIRPASKCRYKVDKRVYKNRPDAATSKAASENNYGNIIAHGDGLVNYAGESSGGIGYTAEIEYLNLYNGECTMVRYMHMDKLDIKSGQHVTRGTVIGSCITDVQRLKVNKRVIQKQDSKNNP